ncbi:MAG TPA: hypothetical protein ENH55_13450 [Aurantimonas coralicida]|uniref:Uncharacterized protein n=1 Tax=marine sediment metagenome TaxID=412755 RepID=A0A0F9THB7_9ZZZZ|nr:hypothetical protein [Aurantimonas coralicida]
MTETDLHEIPEFLRRRPITLPQFAQRSFLGQLWHRLASVLPRLWPKLPPPLRSWRAGRYLIIEMEDDTP